LSQLQPYRNTRMAPWPKWCSNTLQRLWFALCQIIAENEGTNDLSLELEFGFLEVIRATT
jgi:hypothetical protein